MSDDQLTPGQEIVCAISVVLALLYLLWNLKELL